MLRWVVILLALANAGYFLWTQGHLAGWGLAPATQSEPERVDNQVAPESLRLLNAPRGGETRPAPPVPAPASPGDAAGAPAAAGTTPESLSSSAPPTRCWLAGGFSEAQVAPLRVALARLDVPANSWQLEETRSGGRWIVYMGRFDNAASLERKKTELRELNLDFRTVSTPGLGPGLALGTFSTEAAAQQALRDAVRVGVRTARVAQERAESVSFTLRLPAATPAQRTAVAGLGPALLAQALQPCP